MTGSGRDRVWLAQSRAGIQQIVWNEENVENYRRSGWDVEGPYVPEGDLAKVVGTLREIVEADPVDMALDPGWAARIAGAALDGVGEGAGSERDSSRAGDYRRPSARRQEGTG